MATLRHFNRVAQTLLAGVRRLRRFVLTKKIVTSRCHCCNVMLLEGEDYTCQGCGEVFCCRHVEIDLDAVVLGKVYYDDEATEGYDLEGPYCIDCAEDMREVLEFTREIKNEEHYGYGKREMPRR